MTEKESKTREIAARVAGAATIGAATTALSNSVPMGAVAGGLAAGAEILAAWVNDRRRRNLGLWWTSVTQLPGRDPVEVQEEILGRMGDPDVARLVVDQIRRLDEAVADEVIPALALLAREYLVGPKPIDAFFRGASKLLTGSDADDLRHLRWALQSANELTNQGVLQIVIFAVQDELEPSTPELGVRPDFHTEESRVLTRKIECEQAFALVEALTSNRLGNQHGLFGGVGAGMTVKLVRRLHALLSVEA